MASREGGYVVDDQNLPINEKDNSFQRELWFGSGHVFCDLSLDQIPIENKSRNQVICQA